MNRSPLHHLQKEQNAQFKFYENFRYELASSFRPVDEEYQIITNSAGLLDFCFYGRLRLIGKDSLDLINRLSTNDLKNLAQGQSQKTVLTTEKGRIVDVISVYREEEAVLAVCSPGTEQRLLHWFDRFIFREDVKVESITNEICHLAIYGPKSESFIMQSLGVDIRQNQFQRTQFENSSILVSRSESDSYHLFVDCGSAEKLLKFLQAKNIAPIGQDAVETLRIETKQPAINLELSEKYNPLEAGLSEFVSFTKGCYIGQEVVARLDTYNKIQRHLVLLKLDDIPGNDRRIFFENKEVGTITSSIYSYKYKGIIGLGYIKTEFSSMDLHLVIGETPSHLIGQVIS